MKLELKSFQQIAVDFLMEESAEARPAALKGKDQALVLSAPTGSGKTVIATAWLERLLTGDEHYRPDDNATFLWVTDQPELNAQTLRKVSDSSDVFDQTMLVTVEADSFDQELFDPGVVYFLNTQKLSRTSKLTDEEGDFRQYSIWETIRNTATERRDSFWVVIDEAHRGMREDVAAREDARTIVQKFIKGSEQLPPVPLILGISATTQRFTDLLGGTNRTVRPTVVDPLDVRASGLLKDSITLHHPEDEMHSDFTLLADAASRIEEYTNAWRAYSAREEEPPVNPILVVQVEDGTKSGKNQLSRTDLEEAIEIIERVLGPLARDEVAHCFQEGSSVLIGEDARPLDYVAPSDIERAQRLKVIFFKRSLSTGWDCPRAEVMMSFRSAKDETLITQLVGRMVRTPLARRVDKAELLNSVSLYLPYYDEESVDSVIARLSQEDPDAGVPATNVVRGNQVATLVRADKMDVAFEAARGLPIYRVQRV
ncbi:MAG TPA: DEAD/DEAH box helicase family protein, partial [Solirubrobacterales bacterium]|nr:DEAD/DEAH box helicase family protein [Solirubrobacterales bacterium]